MCIVLHLSRSLLTLTLTLSPSVCVCVCVRARCVLWSVESKSEGELWLEAAGMFNDPDVSASAAIEFMEEHNFLEPTPAGVARLFRVTPPFLPPSVPVPVPVPVPAPVSLTVGVAVSGEGGSP